MKPLDLFSIEDVVARENFRKLALEFKVAPILAGEWKLFDLSYSTAGTYAVDHQLGFKPKDLIETFKTAVVTYNYASFSDTKITITTTGAARVRILLGRMD